MLKHSAGGIATRRARPIRFVRVLAAGFAALRAFPSTAALSSAHFRPASWDLGLAFRWPISRARRQMRGDRIKCLGLRTYRTSCINATDSICRRARMESQSVVKLGLWARVDDESNRSRSACGNATCGTFQHFQVASLPRGGVCDKGPLTHLHPIDAKTRRINADSGV